MPDTSKPLTPGSFAKAWGKGMQKIKWEQLEVRPEIVNDDWEFLGTCGFPKSYNVDGFCTEFSGTLTPLIDVLKRQTQIPEHFEKLRFPFAWQSLWHIGDVDYCGSEAWLCIEELTGRIVQVFPMHSRTPELIAENLQQFYTCMFDVREWYDQFKGSMKKGASVIALCRMLHRSHFNTWSAKMYWMPRIEEIFKGEFTHDDGYPDNVVIRFK